MVKDTIAVSVRATSPAHSGRKLPRRRAQPLGTNAFLRTPPPPATSSEVVEAVFGETAQIALESVSRRKRYVLQREARRLMSTQVRINRKGEEVKHRVCHCMMSQRADVNAGARLTSKGAVFTGLQICASTWQCAVCAARITNEWRKRLQDAIDAAYKLGYKAVLVTYTAQHHAHTVLSEQLEAMTKAYEALWRGAPASRLKSQHSILGMIRALEVTHSMKNGWHPHIHAIVFIPIDGDTKAFGEALGARWMAVAARYGLSMNEHGFDVTDASGRLAEYVAKYGHEKQSSNWSEADELARWQTKKGRSGLRVMGKPMRGFDDHLTPFQLLEASIEGDDQAGQLFIEYALAYKGKQQCTPTIGLWKLLGLDEMLTDEEAASKEDEEAAVLLTVQFTPEQWRQVRGQDMRAEFLELLEWSGGDAQLFCDACLAVFEFVPDVYVGQPEAAAA